MLISSSVSVRRVATVPEGLETLRARAVHTFTYAIFYEYSTQYHSLLANIRFSTLRVSN